MRNKTIKLDPKIPVVSYNLRSWQDGPLKLLAIIKYLRDWRLNIIPTQFIHDCGIIGVPSVDLSRDMAERNQKYTIATEGRGAVITNSIIKVPQLSFNTANPHYTGLVSIDTNETIYSLGSDAMKCAMPIFTNPLVSPPGIIGDTPKNNITACMLIIRGWLKEVKADQVNIRGLYGWCRQSQMRFKIFVDTLWRQRHLSAYNEAISTAGMTETLREKDGELPFYLICFENNKYIRRRVFQQNKQWLAEFKNDIKPIDINQHIINQHILVPKIMFLTLLMRQNSYLAVGRGNKYVKHGRILAKALGFKQLPVMEVSMEWRGHKRPFIGWIYNKEGVAGLERTVNNAVVKIVKH